MKRKVNKMNNHLSASLEIIEPKKRPQHMALEIQVLAQKCLRQAQKSGWVKLKTSV
jgi:hypothetical protein